MRVIPLGCVGMSVCLTIYLSPPARYVVLKRPGLGWPAPGVVGHEKMSGMPVAGWLASSCLVALFFSSLFLFWGKGRGSGGGRDVNLVCMVDRDRQATGEGKLSQAGLRDQQPTVWWLG